MYTGKLQTGVAATVIGSQSKSTAESVRVIVNAGATGRTITGTVVEVRGHPSLPGSRYRCSGEEGAEFGGRTKYVIGENLEIWSRELEQGYRIHVAIYIT